MSSTASETLTHETATIRPASAEAIDPAPSERTHFARMAGLYAWILVTLAIFMLAGTLAGMERGAGAADVDVRPVGGVSAHVNTR